MQRLLPFIYSRTKPHVLEICLECAVKKECEQMSSAVACRDLCEIPNLRHLALVEVHIYIYIYIYMYIHT
jgi:hypothetical protein